MPTPTPTNQGTIGPELFRKVLSIFQWTSMRLKQDQELVLEDFNAHQISLFLQESKELMQIAAKYRLKGGTYVSLIFQF